MYEKLLKVQMEIGSIKKDATNPFFKSKYFDINSLLAQVKPILNKHGLVLLQGLTNIDGKLALSTKLVNSEIVTAEKRDEQNNWIMVDPKDSVEFTCPLPEVVDPQKAGSAITYFRRYAIQSLLALEAEDDDGNVASGKVKVEKKTRQEIEDSSAPF